jgi:hypothetical protein
MSKVPLAIVEYSAHKERCGMNDLERCHAEQAECRDYIVGRKGDDMRGAIAGLEDWTAEEVLLMAEDSREQYREFISQKSQLGERHGFEPVWMPNFLFDFQKSLVEWSIQKGRSAMFADCGLGKTPMQLVWAENVHRHTNKPVIIFTPLAVGPQTVREGAKFGINCRRSLDGKLRSSDGIVIANYERIHYFDPNDFAGAVCDESSAIKAFDGKRREQVTEFMRLLPYRLLCTATAAPNDYVELGTSSEALGEMGHMDMLNRFFKNDQNTSDTAHRMHGQVSQWRFKGHSEQHFWRWVCSWARAMRKPSDLGFDDSGFALPPLVTREHIVETRSLAPGMLFAVPASNMREEREERRRTIQERCEMAAELVSKTNEPSVVWCHLNDEGDLLEKIIPGGKQIAGKHSDEEKEERYEAFASGQLRKLVIKPKIGAWGLNWQHCAHVVTFASHSYEQYYQAVRRCWRFGQKRQVTVDVVATEGERGVNENLKRKSDAADRMFSELVAHMNDAMRLSRGQNYEKKVEVPRWL